MKRILVSLFMVLTLLTGCWLKGEDGDDGVSGSSGPPGQDALVSKNSYFFFPVGNPAAAVVDELDFVSIGTGKQTVTVYYTVLGTDWIELPHTQTLGVNEYEHRAVLWDNGVTVSTYEDGVLYAGDALLGFDFMVVVHNYN